MMPTPEPVTPQLWRSGQPIGRDWRELWDHGIRHVIKLNSPDSIDAVPFGMTLEPIHIPDEEAQSKIDPSVLARIDAALDTALAMGRVVLVHCTAGKDRTGIVVARYRVRKQGWSKDDAFKEWERMGSHSYRGLVAAWNAWDIAS